MNKFFLKICAVGALSTILLVSAVPVPASAISMPSLIVCGGEIVGQNDHPCQFNDLYRLGQNIITFIFYLSVPAATVLFSYAGYLYMTAAGDPGQVEKAHEIFKNVAIGFIIICAAWLIVYTILESLINPKFDIIKNGAIKL